MPAPFERRVVRRYTTEAVRVTALLRLPLIGLMALLGPVIHVSHWQPDVFTGLLIVYALVAVIWLAVVLIREVGPWAGWASTAVDVTAVLALCIASGGATSVLLPVFFLLPISVAFQYRPRLTAIVGLCTAVGYQAVWIVYSKRDDAVGFPDEVYLYVGFLLWLAAATTALSYVLVRRSATVISLLDVRKQLVAESMDAEQRERRQLAENVHDGPLQNVLAARLDVEEALERHPDDRLTAAESALREAAGQLRSTVTTLHPQVLAQLGLTAALRELADAHARRGGLDVRTALDEVGHPAAKELLYRVASELLANVGRHAQAKTVELRLTREHGRLVMTVEDDGAGFDPAVVPKRVAQGHIGLASHIVRVESFGGSFDLTSAPGRGTRVVVTVPDAD
ncbi:MULTISPECIES: sensor histidine kinase [Rhodococcus]|uniref:Sensor histidine kinase n=1 Tax=Rhodococcus oxybenzonivorans TaxID=1990687 RepID=A0AAE5A5Z3_9NOCA|nr:MULTISPECIES: sensor histidine kinase [Rhodococcus]MDV7243781.1 sensor histidine kinase [Rhodococcus oxybenzonivorans]MDV7265370.1 sensor histidine kinase [Rhodococcus oxybenzonivorans]MDV7274977.1 sensor histidine kinase [Rhodococcus oxybenzonivorans]MDV7335216.1 sensor histidine kinase [Rhodococcus oxybenzonivorans]MDV7345926.1 sensor histidine kinase [Rhodococcus oxybenzonivorans]